MIIKAGVKLAGIRAEMILAAVIAAGVWADEGKELVITEATGGKHGHGSLHYVGQAIDLRTNYFDELTKLRIAKVLREKLGENYDVVVEKTHIHVEFQPK